ncbi:MAG: hypothetical protein HQL96_01980 [Magnetococcales bacterium]|nr:hypothetical protein [Magnetococcales bacterium]
MFGVSQGAAYGKSKEAWDALGLMQMDPRWSLPERADKNPLIWMVFLKKQVVDIRSYHRETQEVAFEQGLIPFIHSPEGRDDDAAREKGLLPEPTLETMLAGDANAPVVRLVSFEITYDELEDPFNRRLAQVPVDQQKLYDSIYEDPPRAIASLKKLISQYPDIPMFYNWLCIACSRVGDRQAARTAAETNFRSHPGYLFGRLNYAEILLNEGKFREAFDVFGKTFILTELEPNREKFHVSEVLSFYGLVGRYVLRLGKLKSAMRFLDLLKQVEPNHHITQWLEERISLSTPRPIPPDAKRFLSFR